MEQSEVMEGVVKIITPWVKNQDALASVAMETNILEDLKVNSARLVDVVIAFEAEFDSECMKAFPAFHGDRGAEETADIAVGEMKATNMYKRSTAVLPLQPHFVGLLTGLEVGPDRNGQRAGRPERVMSLSTNLAREAP